MRKEHVVMVLGTLVQPGFFVGTRPMHSAQPIEEDVVSKQRDENNAQRSDKENACAEDDLVQLREAHHNVSRLGAVA